MGLFAKAKKEGGRLALTFHGDGIRAGCVKQAPAAKPLVLSCAFYPAVPSMSPETLEKLGKELHSHTYQCGILLGAGNYQLLSVDAPNVPLTELKTAVRWRIKDMLDFPVDDATIDVLDIPIEKNAVGRSHSMFAVVARNSVIEQHQSLFVAAKIDVTVIDIPEMAQRNISALLESEGRGLALLSFNDEGGLLTLTFNGELYLSRRIDVMADQLLDADPEKKELCYDKITLELQRSLDHFDRQFHYITVSKLVLAPSGAVAMREYLAPNLYIPVETMDLADVLDLSKVPELRDATEQQRFFLTLGAALRHGEVAV